jgi:ribosomal protein S18 acetylase RimI-like enzyme
MIIRKAILQDLEDIYQIYSNRYDSHDASSIKYTKSDWEWYLKNDKSIILVGEEDGNLVGLTFTYDMGIWGYMEHVVISEKYRNKGYASQLINSTIDVGRSLGWRILEACYYNEIDMMKEFFQKISWSDGGINTRWVFIEIN